MGYLTAYLFKQGWLKMDNPEYEKFLSEIADDVAKLFAISENRTRFEQHSCDLGKKQAAYSETRNRGANQIPPEPLAGFLSVLTHDKDISDVVPRPKIDEALAYYYFSLATIHDKMRDEGYIPIHNNSEAKQLAKSVWAIIENLCVDRQFIIKTAIDHVEADLAKKPAGTGQKEIVEVKPSVFGITFDIKELARRFWKWVCSRSKD